MRLQLLSDLHLERQPDFEPRPVPGAEVLVLAGDIGSYQAGSLLADDDFGLGRFSPLRPGTPWKTVLYVPGNHEYDGLDFNEANLRLQDLCARLGITWLERQVVILDGVRFVGTTLWSDFDALSIDHAEPRPTPANAPNPASSAQALARVLKQRDKAFRAANHYLRKNTTLREGQPMLAEQLREMGLACQAWLREALSTPFEGTTVAVTHFAPTLSSADPRYGVTPGTAGFCNALDDLLPCARFWLHGHLHCHNDYVVKGQANGADYQCRVIANPLGYASKGEQEAFRPHLCIDLAA